MAKTVFENVQIYDKWQSDYYQPAAIRHYDRAVGRILVKLASPPGSVVLDAGCGPGDHSMRIARTGVRVHSVDISQAVIERARQRAASVGLDNRITFEQADLTQLRFPDNSFGAIFCWGVVIHIPQLERALNELVRILKPGGRLAFQVTNKDAWDYKIVRLGRWLLRKPRLEQEKKPLGHGRWTPYNGGQLWVWQLDIKMLTRYLGERGCCRVSRQAAEFTELHYRVPKFLSSALLKANDIWFGLRMPAGPACTNLLVFEKENTAPSLR